MFHRVSLKFHPNQANPARASGRGLWRVVYSQVMEKPASIRTGHYCVNGRITPLLRMPADRAYKSGSRVDPLKIALAVLKTSTNVLKNAT